MHVGVIHYGLDRQATGIGRYTIELTNALPEQGVDVHRLWAGQRPLNEPGESLPGAYYVPGLLTVGQLGIACKAKELDLDIVHDPVGVMPLTLARTARVLTIHDTIPLVYPRAGTGFHKFNYHIWLPLAVRLADAIITVSDQSRKDIMTHLPVAPERVVVIPEAADRRFRPMGAAEVEPVLRQYGVERPYILYVGALESRKNLPRLLAAYARLRQWTTAWQLVIVGARKWKSSPIFDTVHQLALEPHVCFTGYVADEHLPALYAGADLFTFPSLYEGFGLPVLEAMACGVPVVTSNSSSLPEVAGDAAILVDPYDVEQIAQAMWLVLSQLALAAEMRAKGLARAAQFTWERTAQETAAVYRLALQMR